MCLGSALDIFQVGQPPRATFVDYPLGHSAGQPFAPADQLAIIAASLALFETLTANQGVVTLPHRWPLPGWQQAAMNPAAGDTRAVRDTRPRWQCEADRLQALESGLDSTRR